MTSAVLTVACAWCGRHMSGPPGEAESHGCCAACATEIMAELRP